MQMLTSFLINVLALGTGASYGIANVLLSQMEMKKKANYENSSTTEDIGSRNASMFEFTINSDEASWIGNIITHYISLVKKNKFLYTRSLN